VPRVRRGNVPRVILSSFETSFTGVNVTSVKNRRGGITRTIGNWWNSVLFIRLFYIIFFFPSYEIRRNVSYANYRYRATTSYGPYDRGHCGGCRAFRRLLKSFIALFFLFFFLHTRTCYCFVCVRVTLTKKKKFLTPLAKRHDTRLVRTHTCRMLIRFVHIKWIIIRFPSPPHSLVVFLTNRSPLVFRETETISKQKERK
jgi:hypothetical protein